MVLIKVFAFVTPRSPALRPAGRTGVRSKCSLHFSAFFAANHICLQHGKMSALGDVSHSESDNHCQIKSELLHMKPFNTSSTFPNPRDNILLVGIKYSIKYTVPVNPQ